MAQKDNVETPTSAFAQPLVSAVIPTYRRGEVLLGTIEMLRNQTYSPLEIIVVDQTPEDEYPEAVRHRLHALAACGAISLIRQKEPLVYPARNRAAAVAKGECFLWLDDDIEIEPEFVRRHVRNFRDPTVAAVAGRVVHPHALDPRPTLRRDFWKLRPQEQAFYFRDGYAQRLESVCWLAAGNFCVRRQAFFGVGGWDEHILNYGDRDLAIRLTLAGWRIVFDPEARVVHLSLPWGGSRLTDPQAALVGWRAIVSVLYLAWKHLKGWPFLKFGIWRAARFSFLLKRHVMQPWHWPYQVYSFLKACWVARRWAQEGMKSPFWQSAGTKECP